jgi:hypothetical protein
MKKMPLLTLSVLVLICASFSSCKKDKKDKNELLTEKTWIVVKQEAKTDPGDWQDDTNSYDACELDNITRFLADGSYQITEGATKCDPSDPDTYEAGVWTLNSAGTQLTMDGIPFTVERLDNSALIVTLQIFPGISNRATFNHP